MEPLTHCDAWKALWTHYEAIERVDLRDLFANDPGRGKGLTTEGVGPFLDYSKNRVTDETIELLIQLKWPRSRVCRPISYASLSA
jgi:glucose-6-phosphate isomerase